MAVIKVWVEEGCTVCNECEEAAPDIFLVNDETSVIKGDARTDGVTDRNEDAMAPLKDGLGEEWAEGIEEAAEACPVDIIKFETDD